MTQVPYQIISNGDTATVTAFYPEVGPKVANNDHPAYADIKAGLEAGDDVLDLFDASMAAARYFKKVSDRVSVSNGHVYFDGDEIDPPAARSSACWTRAPKTGTRSCCSWRRSSRTRPSTRARSFSTGCATATSRSRRTATSWPTRASRPTPRATSSRATPGRAS